MAATVNTVISYAVKPAIMATTVNTVISYTVKPVIITTTVNTVISYTVKPVIMATTVNTVISYTVKPVIMATTVNTVISYTVKPVIMATTVNTVISYAVKSVIMATCEIGTKCELNTATLVPRPIFSTQQWIWQTGPSWCLVFSSQFLKQILSPLVILSISNAIVTKVISKLKSVSRLKIFSETGPKAVKLRSPLLGVPNSRGPVSQKS